MKKQMFYHGGAEPIRLNKVEAMPNPKQAWEVAHEQPREREGSTHGVRRAMRAPREQGLQGHSGKRHSQEASVGARER